MEAHFILHVENPTDPEDRGAPEVVLQGRWIDKACALNQPEYEPAWCQLSLHIISAG